MKRDRRRLTPDIVRKIKMLASQDNPPTQQQLSEMFDVTQPTVSKILSGKRWKEINVVSD